MSSQADGTAEQKAFGNWISDQLAYLKAVRGLSMRAACKLAGVSHTQVYSWMGQPESSGYSDASPAAVRKFCTALKLDYNEAARILGWVKSTPAPETDDPERYIRQARAIAEHSGTSERRRRSLEAQIKLVELSIRTEQEAARAKREAEGLLRDALENSEDVNDR